MRLHDTSDRARASGLERLFAIGGIVLVVGLLFLCAAVFWRTIQVQQGPTLTSTPQPAGGSSSGDLVSAILTQAQNVLTLAQNELNRDANLLQDVAIALSVAMFLMTVGGGIFAYFFLKRLETVEEAAEKVKQDASTAFQTSNSNLVASANLALLGLPDITFSQQLPLELLSALEILYNVFAGPHRRQLWRSLDHSEESARIAYAMGLYILGRDGLKPSRLQHSSAESGPPTAVRLFKTAWLQVDNAEKLRQDIVIRLFQTYRQIGDFESAMKECIEPLPVGHLTSMLLRHWATIVLSLQKALPESLQGRGSTDRRRDLRVALESAQTLKNNEQLWRIADEERRAAIQYYCAKACWVLRFSMNDRTGATNFDDVFTDASDKAATNMIRAIDAGIRDDFTKVIYLASLAYLKLAWRLYPHGRRAEKLPKDDDDTPERLIVRAKSLCDSVWDDSLPIYNDHAERFTNKLQLRQYLEKLETFCGNDNAIWEYYSIPD